MVHKTKQPWVETPLIESRALSEAAGCRIFLKLELLQPSGSFKSRGIGHMLSLALAASPSPQKTHFYCSSGGNAGLACIHAARTLSRPATIIVPLSTSAMMLAKLRAAGAAAVIQHGASWREADEFLRGEVMRDACARGEEAVYVPPFEHPDIWTGHASLVDEVAAQMEGVPDVLVCSVGGGGLLNGIVEGVDRQDGNWTPTILAVETEGADSLAFSLSKSELDTLPGITSLATSLGASRVSPKTFEIATTRKEQVRSVVLSDAEAAMGCWRLADDERLIVELACGVNVALCYGGRLEKALGRPVRKEDKVVIVVCGGSNVTVDLIAEYKARYGRLDDEVSEQEKARVASAAVTTNGVH